MLRLLEALGSQVLAFIRHMGSIILLLEEVLFSFLTGRVPLRRIFAQIASVGFASQLVILVTGGFTGAVLTAQTYFQFQTFSMEKAVGSVVAVAMFRELGPVLTGLMLAGRVGSSMTAEIGTMKVSDQIDALRSLAIHPVDYLVAPRVLAMVISIPLLILESIFIGILCSYLVAVQIYGVDNAWHWEHIRNYCGPTNLVHPIVKGIVFGLIIALIACWHGLQVSNGAAGVGKSTTKTVVVAALTLIIFNFFITIWLNFLFPAGFYNG